MGLSLLGRKIGMTRVLAGGVSTPVTVIEVGPCVVTQLRTPERDGYAAVQIGYADVHPRNSTRAMITHDFNAGAAPKRVHREFRVTAEELTKFQPGQALTVKDLDGAMFVDVTGTSKGKGFQGVMKRWHFKGMCGSHGTERKHRSPGSIGSYGSNRGFGGGLLKGKKMSGHMGDDRVTVRNLDVVRVEPERNLILVKGPVPGANSGVVSLRASIRLYRGKAKRLAAAGEQKAVA